jgi:formylglycine-generating enzyme required for sulfatase activity
VSIRVEPALLRAVRYLLPARTADVGSEAAAWNHPHVYPTPLAFYYDHEAIEQYHAAFAGQPLPLRQQVAALLSAYHAHLSPVIGYEEQLLLARYGSVPEPIEARQALERLVKTLHTPDDAWRDTVHAWVHRLSHRQFITPIWHDDALAAAWATVHLEQPEANAALPLPAGFDLARVSWLLAGGRVPGQYTLCQRGQMLWVTAEVPTMDTPLLETPGSPLCTMHATVPHVQVQYRTADGTSSAAQLQGLDQAISLPADASLLLRTDHQELTIDSIARPAWAESIGRDAQGLFVTWVHGQRRAYWVLPGVYPIFNRAGERVDQVALKQGYWCDAAAALVQLRDGFRQPPWAEAFGRDEYGLYADFSMKDVSHRMRWIAPGEFAMGSPPDEAERFDDETLHQVILSRGFWLADTACTQALWQAVLERNPSHFKGADQPVEQVSWDDVQGFLTRLNAMMPGQDFRLPTEAEWEYACRAGTTSPFWFGEQITPEQVNYNGNYPYAGGTEGKYREETVPVKALPCNSWGLYQMHGNVWEWCQDWQGEYPTGTVIDPTGPDTGAGRVLRGGTWFNLGADRVLRGGGWFHDGRHARAARRHAFRPGYRNLGIGFRLARGQAAGGRRRRQKKAARAGLDRRSGAGLVGHSGGGNRGNVRHAISFLQLSGGSAGGSAEGGESVLCHAPCGERRDRA